MTQTPIKKKGRLTLDATSHGDESDLSSNEALEDEFHPQRKQSPIKSHNSPISPLGSPSKSDKSPGGGGGQTVQEDRTFFREDEDDDKETFKNNRYTSDKNYYKERQLYEVEISLKFFFTYFLYHFIFLYTIGPFMVLFFLIGKHRGKYRNIFNNIMFTRFSSGRFWLLMLWWIVNVTIIVGYFYNFDYHSQFASSVILYSLISNSLVRIFSMAANYATLSNNIQSLISTERLESKVMDREDMLGSWSKQDHHTISENIKAAFFASQLESSIMWMNFMSRPSEKAEDHLFKLQSMADKTENCLSGEHMKVVDLGNPKRTARFYNSLTVFYYLLVRSNTKVYGLWAISFLVGIIKTFGPYFIASGIKQEYPFKNKAEFCITLALNLFLLYLNTHNIAYFLLAIMDLDRKNSVSSQLSNINSIHRTQGNIRYLPMINFLDFTTLWSWKSMLTINKNYGKKYFIRHQMFLAFVLITTLTNYYVLKKVLEDSTGFDKEEYESISVCFFIYFDLFSFYWMLLTLLIKAGNFNSYYSEHLYRIQTKVLVLEKVRLFQRHYVRGSSTINQNGRASLIPKVYSKHLFSDGISNSLIKALCSEIYHQIPRERIDYHLEQLIKYHRSMIEEITNEKDTESMKIIGIKISKQIIQSVVLFCMPFALELHHRLCILIWGQSPFHL